MNSQAASAKPHPQVTQSENGQRFPIPHIPEALSSLRRHARAVLAGWGLPQEVIDDTVLVLSELVSNAVMHALPPAVLFLSCDRIGEGESDVVVIEVTDSGPASQARKVSSHRLPEEHGRGSSIIEALSIEHGTRHHADGVTWWAQLRTA